jgi:SAM-dependent methyltransferase
VEDPRAANRANWDERVPIHLASAFYDVEGFRTGRLSLEPFELAEVGDVSGRDLVHLQCHFGLDTLSWAQLGAEATGLDFSEPAVESARRLAAEMGIDARFVCADVLDAPCALGAEYDIVYTGHGALNWVPDLDRWADGVAALLRPGGFVYLSEFHPASWVVDEREPRLVGDYFDRGPHRWDEPGTYADPEAVTTHNVTYEWNYGLGEVVSVLTGRGLFLEFLHERPYTLFPAFPWLDRHDDGTYRPRDGAPRVPLMYSLRATKPASTRG